MKRLQILSIIGLVIFTSMTTTQAIAATRDYPIIDAHIHVDDKASQDEFFKQAKANGIKAFIAHTHDENSETPKIGDLNSTYCLGVQDKFNLVKIEAGLKSKKFGCVKIYLGYIYKYAYDKAYLPIYKLAEKYQIPIVFHTGDTNTSKGKLKYADPMTIDEVAVDYPKVNFIMAHLGNPWINTASEVAYKNPNVYVDMSALLIGDISSYSQDDLQKYLIGPISWAFGYMESSKKMMYGSDFPLADTGKYLQAVLKAIPAANHREFLYENAARVFNIKVK